MKNPYPANFPSSTYVGKFLPKSSFYERSKIRAAVKNAFQSDIERITWIYKISPDTLNITAGAWPEMEIFQIDLKHPNFHPEILKAIDTLVPYPILFFINFKDQFKFYISYKELSKLGKVKVDMSFETDWNELDISRLKINGLSTDTIYANFISVVAGYKFKEEARDTNQTKSSLDETKEDIEKIKKREIIKKQIDALTRKISRESSIAKKQELAEERFRLRKEMEKI